MNIIWVECRGGENMASLLPCLGDRVCYLFWKLTWDIVSKLCTISLDFKGRSDLQEIFSLMTTNFYLTKLTWGLLPVLPVAFYCWRMSYHTLFSALSAFYSYLHPFIVQQIKTWKVRSVHFFLSLTTNVSIYTKCYSTICWIKPSICSHRI